MVSAVEKQLVKATFVSHKLSYVKASFGVSKSQKNGLSPCFPIECFFGSSML